MIESPRPEPAATAVTDIVLADYFDGRSARPRRVQVSMRGDYLQVEGDGLAVAVPLAGVRWPERQRHGSQVVNLPDGASLHARPDQSWQALRAATTAESWVVRAQQSWRVTGLAIVALLGVLLAGWLWGIPLAAIVGLAVLPDDVDQYIGGQMASSMETQMFGPSQLSEADQDDIRRTLAAAVARAWPNGGAPDYELRFVDGKKIGPNALALPGGTIFLTDQLVELARKPGRDDADPQAMVIGVLAHELGHVDRRHGMRSAAQAMLIGVVASVVLGDISSLAAGVPVMLVQSGYSRDFEREADSDSVRILRAAGYSPAAMASFFERIAERRSERRNGNKDGKDEKDGKDDSDQGLIAISLNSHPADAERIAYFRDAAR